MMKELRELEYISQSLGKYSEYVQGGGGNTSVKTESGLMIIKASGYKLSDVTATDAITFIDYNKIKRFIEKSTSVVEKEFTNIINEAQVLREGYADLRPSIEVGFHALLGKYVIHTHSVYSNILNCCKNQEQLIKEIFKEEKFVIIGFESPGVALTIHLNKKVQEYYNENKVYPEILFLKNHGIIISCDVQERALMLHEKVTLMIKKHFKLEDNYPKILLDNSGDMYRSRSDFKRVTNMQIGDILELIGNNILFPDQIVYFNLAQGIKKEEKFLVLDGTLYYKTSISEALAMEETMMAYMYIYEEISKNGLKVSEIEEQKVRYIMNMESEKYRKKIISNDKN